MKKTIKVGSDFSGVGAFDQALMRLGIDYETEFACDMDKYARTTYIHNYGEPKYYPQNVYNREIPTESLDIYMTSPPCQSFSIAGKRLGKDDKRGVLFFNSHEFIAKNKPRFFIFENVKGLLSDDNGKTFQEWINLLGGKSVNGLPILFSYEDSVPYHIYWKVLNAKEHGVPQNRERVFIIGIRDDQDNNFRFPVEEHLTKRLKDVLENEVTDKYFLSEKIIANFEVKSLKENGFKFQPKYETDETANCILSRYFKMGATDNYLKVMQLNASLESGGKQPYQQNRVYNSEAVCVALNAGQVTWGGNIVTLPNDYRIRRLTPRECFRLMNFPDSFDFSCVSDSQAYKQAGNSIVVRVLEKIIKNLNL
jgi:DNA (cytosine-5)-methyltransferase 1